MYSQLQPWIRPELVNLLEHRIYVLSTFLLTVVDKQEEQEIWCQGVVKLVLKDLRQPLVIVNWDGMPDVKVREDSHESAQKLLPSMYNQDKDRTWKMDVDVELCEAYESDNYDCDGSDDDSSSDYNEMSEEEDDIDDIEEVLSDVNEIDDGNSRISDE